MKTVLNLYGPINRLGYGVHFTHWAGTLAALIAKEMGEQVSVTAVHQSLDLHNDALKDPVIHACVMRSQDLSLFDPKAPSVCLWQLPWVTEFAGSKRIFYTTFEGTLLTPNQQKALTKVDELWVTSHWHLERLADMKRRGLVPDIPVEVVAEGVDPKTFNYADTGLLGEWGQPGDDETIRFVSVGKLEARKGMKVAMAALLDAAAIMPEKRLKLLAHWHNPFLRTKDGGSVPFLQAVSAFLYNFGIKPSSDIADGRSVRFTHSGVPNLEIEVILRRFERHEDLISVYRYGHFGLFPTFAEGWNLPLHESMACGLPPITNAYSGQTEYLQQGTFVPCGPGVDVIARDEQFFRRGDVGTWREIRVEELSGAIQIAANMTPEERKHIAERASKAALVYTWDRAAQTSLKILRDGGTL